MHRASRVALGVAALLLAANPASAAELKDGAYKVSGTDAKKGAYTGEVRLAKKDARTVAIRAVYEFKRGGKESFGADGALAGDRLTFSYEMKGHGFLHALAGIFGGNKAKKITATYTIADGSLAGTWTASNDAKFRRTDTWTLLLTEIDRVEPASVAMGAHHAVVTIVGKDLPMPSDLATKDVAFLLGGAVDARLSVDSIGERTDDATRLKVTIDVDKSARQGKRSVRLLDASKADALTVDFPDVALPLGGEREISADERAKLVIPLGGGTLTLHGSAKPRLFDPNDVAVEGDVARGVEIKTAGVYHVDLGGAKGKISNVYRIDGETKPENKPYNFWYWPFYEEPLYQGRPLNLYADGGVYEKLDLIFGNTPTHEAFDQTRHMDAKAMGDAKFKMPTAPAEVAKYDPSTIKSYAYCYQRTTDKKKDWWGHCWGAVIASSLHRRPHDTTIATVGSGSVTLDEEEMKGVLSAYYSNHSVDGNWYIGHCPPGRPSEKEGEDCDHYCHDLWRALNEGIKSQGVPLASNLRAQSTNDKDGGQVWNHVIWRFEATLKEAPKKNDTDYVEIAIKVFATDDIFPSTNDRPRIEDYVIRLRTKDGAVVPDAKDENWVSATHFCPSYVARITGSLSGDWGCENAKLGQVGIARLTEKLGYVRITGGSP